MSVSTAVLPLPAKLHGRVCVSWRHALDAFPYDAHADDIEGSLATHGFVGVCNSLLYFKGAIPSFIEDLPDLVSDACDFFFEDHFDCDGLASVTRAKLLAKVNASIDDAAATGYQMRALVPNHRFVHGSLVCAEIPAHQLDDSDVD